jgi:hypothetical protein
MVPLFIPVDENALRHLFTRFERSLGLYYLGPILNARGTREESPDSLVWDDQAKKLLRCEFKCKVNGRGAFSKNGKFDLAIVWAIEPKSRTTVEAELRQKNGCAQILELSLLHEFRHAIEYNVSAPQTLQAQVSGDIQNRVRRLNHLPSKLCAYVTAVIGPGHIKIVEMCNLLRELRPELEGMQNKGAQNYVTALWMRQQKHEGLGYKTSAGTYTWNPRYDAATSANLIEQELRPLFRKIPTRDEVQKLKRKHLHSFSDY